MSWQRSFGGSEGDAATSICQTRDGGYIVACGIFSVVGDVIGNHGMSDFLIVKLDPNGSVQWCKCYGGSNEDNANSIQQTKEGGYINAGWSKSIVGDIQNNHGYWDYWVVKLSSETNVNGELEIPSAIYCNPNPANDFIEISVGSQGSVSNQGIRIFNVFGEIVSTSVCSADTSASGGQRIDVSGLPSGVYFIRVGDKVMKFVKI